MPSFIRAVFFYYYKPSCPYSQSLRPVIECLPKFFAPSVLFFAVDVKTLPSNMVLNNGIMATPKIRLLKKEVIYSRDNQICWKSEALLCTRLPDNTLFSIFQLSCRVTRLIKTCKKIPWEGLVRFMVIPYFIGVSTDQMMPIVMGQCTPSAIDYHLLNEALEVGWGPYTVCLQDKVVPYSVKDPDLQSLIYFVQKYSVRPWLEVSMNSHWCNNLQCKCRGSAYPWYWIVAQNMRRKGKSKRNCCRSAFLTTQITLAITCQ